MKKLILFSLFLLFLTPFTVCAQEFDKKMDDYPVKQVQKSYDTSSIPSKESIPDPEICIWRESNGSGFSTLIRECHSQQQVCESIHQYEKQCTDKTPQDCIRWWGSNTPEAVTARHYSIFCNNADSRTCINDLSLAHCTSTLSEYLYSTDTTQSEVPYFSPPVIQNSVTPQTSASFGCLLTTEQQQTVTSFANQYGALETLGYHSGSLVDSYYDICGRRTVCECANYYRERQCGENFNFIGKQHLQECAAH